MTLQPPLFESSDAFQQAAQRPLEWMPLLRRIAEQQNLPLALEHVQVGVGGTYPTFLAGDVVIKLFGFLPHWRDAYDVELAALRLVGRDASILAPHLLAWGTLFETDQNSWPYLLISRMSGVSWDRADLSAVQKLRVAADLGEQLGKLRALTVDDFEHRIPAATPSLTAAARRSSLPSRLLPELATFAERFGSSTATSVAPGFVHGDMMFRHVFVRNGRLMGLIDWGDALVTDPHYELVQVQLNLFERDPQLLKTLLDAAGWRPCEDFPQRCLLMAFHRQAHGLAQHLSMDVFYRLPEWVEPGGVPDLEHLADMLFGLDRV